jgi:fibronectin-binding autotransporter adhesin
LILLIVGGSQLKAENWTNTASTAYWTNSGYWNPNSFPNATDAVANFLASGVNRSITNDVTITLGYLSINSSIAGTILNSAPGGLFSWDVSSGSALATLSNGTFTMNASSVLLDPLIISNLTANSGGITWSGNITNNSYSITSAGSSGTTIGGIITGSGGLIKTDSNTLTLSGANDYTGGTLISAGTLVGTSTALQGQITNNAI